MFFIANSTKNHFGRTYAGSLSRLALTNIRFVANFTTGVTDDWFKVWKLANYEKNRIPLWTSLLQKFIKLLCESELTSCFSAGEEFYMDHFTIRAVLTESIQVVIAQLANNMLSPTIKIKIPLTFRPLVTEAFLEVRT